jgi:glycosyltransferase involved in cell wall biosynthesis
VGYIRTYQLKKVTGKLDKLVVLTNQDKEQWTRTHDNVVCIANPSPFKINQNSYFVDSKTVISVGRLDAQKGYDKLVDAWSIVKKSCPDWKLNIFGSGELYEFLNRRISSLALENNVDLKGVSSHIEKEYLSASFFVMSSLFEGLPMVLIEAATFGLPIVSYDCEWGPREIVNNGLNGYLVPAGDIEMLAARIIELINNPGLRIQMSENAKEASKNYELSIIMNQWKDLFENLNK